LQARTDSLDPFQLAEAAILDIDEIWGYLFDRENAVAADHVVSELFAGFYRLAANPLIGHRRTDLTNRSVLFYKVFSYLIVYEPTTRPILVAAVLHGKRNVSRILSQRSMM